MTTLKQLKEQFTRLTSIEPNFKSTRNYLTNTNLGHLTTLDLSKKSSWTTIVQEVELRLHQEEQELIRIEHSFNERLTQRDINDNVIYDINTVECGNPTIKQVKIRYILDQLDWWHAVPAYSRIYIRDEDMHIKDEIMNYSKAQLRDAINNTELILYMDAPNNIQKYYVDSSFLIKLFFLEASSIDLEILPMSEYPYVSL